MIAKILLDNECFGAKIASIHVASRENSHQYTAFQLIGVSFSEPYYMRVAERD